MVALILVLIFLRFVPLGLWITSLAAGVHISIGSLIGMRLRRIQPKRLVEPLIKARKAGLDVTLSKLEKKEPVKILIYGDSIASGCNSSSDTGDEPFAPKWYEMMEAALKKKYS